MSETSEKREVKVQSLEQAFSEVNKDGQWMRTTKYHKELVKAIGILDLQRKEFGNVLNNSAALLNKVLKHLNLDEAPDEGKQPLEERLEEIEEAVGDTMLEQERNKAGV